MRAASGWPTSCSIVVDMTSGDGRERVDALHIQWFCTHEMDGFTRLDRWLSTVRSELPDALPVRFQSRDGSSTFEWSERMLFRDAARAGSVSWEASPPFFGGFIVGIRSPLQKRSPPFVSVTINVNYWTMLDDPMMRQVFASVGSIGEALGAFYAMGLHDENFFLGEGRLAHGAGSKAPRPYVMDQDHWLGLPWKGVDFEWFGPPYVPLIGEPARIHGEGSGGGIFMRYNSAEERFALLPVPLLATYPDGGPAATIPTALS